MNIGRLDLDLLRSFVSFVESRNMIEASDQLQISQPLLTKHLQLLEASAGQPLFYMEGRKKRPTVYGERLYKLVKTSLEGLSRDIQNLEVMNQEPSQVSISIGGRREILESLAARLQFEGRVEYRPMSGMEAIQALKDRKIEIGISQHPLESFEFVQKSFFRDGFHVAYPSQWRIDSRSLKPALDELIERPYLSYGESDVGSKLLSHFNLSLKNGPARLFANWSVIAQMVQNKMGWAVMPGFHLKGGMGSISVAENIFSETEFYLLYAKEYSSIAWFKKLIAEIQR